MRYIYLSSAALAYSLLFAHAAVAEDSADEFGLTDKAEKSEQTESYDLQEKPKKRGKRKKAVKKEPATDFDSADPFSRSVEGEKTEAQMPAEPAEKPEGLEPTDGLDKVEGVEKTDESVTPETEKRKGKKGKKGKKKHRKGEATDAELAAPVDGEVSTGPKALEGTVAYLGLGSVKMKGDLGTIAGRANEISLQLSKQSDSKGAFGFGYGIGYRYGKAEKSAVSPQVTSVTARVKHEQHNVDFNLGVNFTLFAGLGLDADLAGVVQLDSLLITMPDGGTLGDDYYMSYGIGALSRFGLHYKFTKLIVRLNYEFETGRKQQSQTLYFNNKQLDINPAQTIIGLQFGYQL